MRLSTLAGLVLATAASATFVRRTGVEVGPFVEDDDTYLLGSNGTNGWGTFDQLLDHSNPALGTFKQRFWYGTQYWKGPGSPIFLFTPGESPADVYNKSYTTLQRLPGLMAQVMGGAVVIMEHRYWGDSSPYEDLTVDHLKYLTLENAIKDCTYFARNFEAPFDNSSGSTPDKAPWVFTSGSYPGALAGWIASVDPGTFWAYHGTSAVVEAIADFWEYFVPVMEATPQNCSTDLTAVIDYVDDVLQHGSDAQKNKLKAKFLLQDLGDADFAAALVNGPGTWQSTQFSSTNVTGISPYYQFCDYVENVWPNSTAAMPGPEGVGQCKALQGYAKWFVEISLPGACASFGYDEWMGELNSGCFSTNASSPVYKDLSVRNPVNRQWWWFLCNQPFGYWQDGAPRSRPTIVSRLVNQQYWEDQCALHFPAGYGIAQGKTEAAVNAYTGGWDIDKRNTSRLMLTNGALDPWRDSTVSSIFRPGGPLQSTPQLPVRVIPGGTHCSDLYGSNWAVNAGVKKIVDDEVENMKVWVGEFYKQKRETREWMA